MSVIAPSGAFRHPSLGSVFYQVREVSDDPDTQVGEVIGMMRDYAVADSKSPYLLGDLEACSLYNGDPVEAVWKYLNRYAGARGVQFVRDEATGAPWDDSPNWRPLVEALIRPADQAVLSNPQGDCDDFAMYGAALLLALSVPCSFATVAADPSDPSIYSHVYLVAYPQTGIYAGQRVPMDLSHGKAMGWECPNAFGKFREWPVERFNVAGLLLLGLGGYLAYRVLVN